MTTAPAAHARPDPARAPDASHGSDGSDGERAPHPAVVVGVLTLGLCAISTAAILIRLASDAPSLVIAFWRVVFSLLILAPLLLRHQRLAKLRALPRRERWRLVGAGVCLGVHFWSWITSLAYTSVAASVLLVTTNPIWVALLSPWLLSERATVRTIAGIGIATCGTAFVVLGAETAASAPDPLLGNALALVGAISGSGYLMLGRSARQRLDLPTYAVATLALATVVIAVGLGARGDVELFAWDASTWAAFAALALGPQLVGHNAISWTLKWVRADIVALSILTEPIGAAALAWLVLGETPGWAVVVGGALLLGGIAVATFRPRGRRRR